MKKLSFILILVLFCVFVKAQNNMSLSVHSYTTAQSMPFYGVALKADTNAFSPYYFPPVLYYMDANGEYHGMLPSMPVGTRFHFETYDSCIGTTLGPIDTFQANLSYATGFFVCGNNAALPVSGTVYVPPMLPATGAMVYFITKCMDTANSSYTLAVVDSVQTTMNGTYTLNNYPAMQQGCQLIVKAAFLPGSPFYAGHLPTYYGPGVGSFSWNGAVMVMPNSSGNDIYMLPGTNPGGPGFIGGSVLQGANKTTGVGDPLNKRILILTDMNDAPVAYTYSDAAGEFSFPGIAYGSYKLRGDAMGKDNPPLTVVLSAANNSVTDIIFKENSTSFKGGFTTGVNNTGAIGEKLTIYPNPVADEIYIEGAELIKGSKHVQIVGMNGSVIASYNFLDGELVRMPAAHLSAGIYLVKISAAKAQTILKLVK